MAISFTVDAKNNRIEQAVSHYENHPYKVYEKMSYEALDFNYQGEIFSTAASKVFAKDGKLKPQYVEYTLINNHE